jgi:hypothetical protein
MLVDTNESVCYQVVSASRLENKASSRLETGNMQEDRNKQVGVSRFVEAGLRGSGESMHCWGYPRALKDQAEACGSETRRKEGANIRC